MIIYMATNKINGKKYIGQTVKELTERKKGHKYDALHRNRNIPFHNAIKKYGMDNFEWDVIWKGTERQDDPYLLDRMERRFMKEYEPEYNVRTGGQNGYRHSDDTKEKMKETWRTTRQDRLQKFIVTTPDGTEVYIDDLSLYCQENDLHYGAMIRVAAGYARTHKKYSIVYRDKMDRERAEHTRQNQSKANSRNLRYETVKLVSPDNDIYEVSNISEFCREHDLSRSAISLVIKGYRKSHKGWRAG